MFMLQPTIASAAIAAVSVDHRGMGASRKKFMSASSVGDFDDGRQGTELGILEPVHPYLEGIAVEARHFRIEPCVLRNREQVAPDEAETDLTEIAQADRAELSAAEGVVHRQLLQLGVRAALDEEVVWIEAVVEADPVIGQRLLRTRWHRVCGRRCTVGEAATRQTATWRSIGRFAELILHTVTGCLERPLPRAV